jgi:hypothetical protein
MPSAPMTAQRQRTTGVWLVRFPCCGKRFPNQTQAVRQVVYLSPTDKYPRLTRRLSKGQKVLYERALVASQRPSEPW